MEFRLVRNTLTEVGRKICGQDRACRSRLEDLDFSSPKHPYSIKPGTVLDGHWDPPYHRLTVYREPDYQEIGLRLHEGPNYKAQLYTVLEDKFFSNGAAGTLGKSRFGNVKAATVYLTDGQSPRYKAPLASWSADGESRDFKDDHEALLKYARQTCDAQVNQAMTRVQNEFDTQLSGGSKPRTEGNAPGTAR